MFRTVPDTLHPKWKSNLPYPNHVCHLRIAQTPDQRRLSLALGHWRRCVNVTGYTAGRKRRLKTEVCGGRRGLSSPCGFPLFLRGGHFMGNAVAPMCDQGFGPPAGGLPALRAGEKRKRYPRNQLFARRGSGRSPTHKSKGGRPQSDSCRCSPAG
jgi:hypothetical protein